MKTFKEHIKERAKYSSRGSKSEKKSLSKKSDKKSKDKKLNIKAIMKKLAVGAGAGLVGGIAFKNFLQKNAGIIGDISINFLK